jgi:hypothetical protein
LVVHRKGQWDWEDWGENIDAPLLDNAWYALALKSAIKMAKLVSADADVAGYQKQLDSITAKYDKTFWAKMEYRSPAYKGDTDDRGNALAVLAGLAPRERYDALKTVLMKHRNCSPWMERFVSEAQFGVGDVEGAMTRMKERYGPMVADPLTTLWEQFKKSDGTYNHGWSGGPLIMLSEYVVGIAPTSAGFDTYDVRPNLGKLQNASAKMMTIKGPIAVSIKRQSKGISMKVTSPHRAVARVLMPVEGLHITQARVNGKPVPVKVADGRIEFEVPAGAVAELEASE